MELIKSISKRDENNWKEKLRIAGNKKKEKAVKTGTVTSVANIDKVLNEAAKEKKRGSSLKVIKKGKPWTKELKKSSKAVSEKKLAVSKRENGKIKKLEKNEAAKSALTAKKPQNPRESRVKKSKETKKQQGQVIIPENVKKLFVEAANTWGQGAITKNGTLRIQNGKAEVETYYTTRLLKGTTKKVGCVRFSRADGTKVKNWLFTEDLSRFRLCEEVLEILR